MKKRAKKKSSGIAISTLYKRIGRLSGEIDDLKYDIGLLRQLAGLAQMESAASLAGRLRDTNRQLADLSRGVARLLAKLGVE